MLFKLLDKSMVNLAALWSTEVCVCDAQAAESSKFIHGLLCFCLKTALISKSVQACHQALEGRKLNLKEPIVPTVHVGDTATTARAI